LHLSTHNAFGGKLRVKNALTISVPDPGSSAILPQGSGIRDDFFPDPGSRIPDPYLPRPKFKILPLKMAKTGKIKF
jgi:hypothetical protein